MQLNFGWLIFVALSGFSNLFERVECFKFSPYKFSTKSAVQNVADCHTILTAKSKAMQVTENTFKSHVIESNKPVLVFFSAAWCGPCSMMTPIVDELVEEYSEHLNFVEICAEENPKCVSECQVRSVPTLIVFWKGKADVTLVGAIPKKSLIHSLRDFLGEPLHQN
mmetsp:Transcript_10910/g.15502  ORF Transcript_10910/g.15502 Transcript_10910/m.15502 type:complete len:166 (+) Transcript_10910:36-533(+)